MIDDPDELMKYPEIRAIMGSGDVGESTVEEDSDKAMLSTTVPVDIDGESGLTKVKASSAGGTSGKSGGAPSAAAITATTATAADGDEGVDDEDAILEEVDSREHLNIVFIGHVDAGKSTLSGSILYIMGMVDKRTIEKYEREAKERNRESWFLAFIMDTSEEERAKGKTVEVGRAHFATETNRYTILDAPGHKNYVPNMISGASQADVAVLVISARRGEFETGFEKGGQTREHALLAKTLGVRYLLVVVNKMDDPTVNWEASRYEECVGKLKPFLKGCGYAIKRDVRFLPISGLSGDNILREVSEATCPWWKGLYSTGQHNTTTPTLLSTLDSLVISGRDPEAPLRIPCVDRYFERGCVILGKVEAGTIRIGDDILIAPTRKIAKVDAIYVEEKKVRFAKPGENILIKIAVNVEDVQRGFVLCHPLSPCRAVREVKVQLAMVDLLEHRPLFTQGYECVMHIHTVEIECVCTRLVCVIVNQKPARLPFAKQGQMCEAILSFPSSTCVEMYSALPALGRLTLRDEGQTIAIGKIVDLIA